MATSHLESLDIETIPWPPNSPELNPIENLWALLKRRIRSRSPPPKTLADLRIALEEEWANLAAHPEDWRFFIESMPTRVHSVIAAHGFSTKF